MLSDTKTVWRGLGNRKAMKQGTEKQQNSRAKKLQHRGSKCPSLLLVLCHSINVGLFPLCTQAPLLEPKHIRVFVGIGLF
jgi:hypothetical protein